MDFAVGAFESLSPDKESSQQTVETVDGSLSGLKPWILPGDTGSNPAQNKVGYLQGSQLFGPLKRNWKRLCLLNRWLNTFVGSSPSRITNAPVTERIM